MQTCRTATAAATAPTKPCGFESTPAMHMWTSLSPDSTTRGRGTSSTTPVPSRIRPTKPAACPSTTIRMSVRCMMSNWATGAKSPGSRMAERMPSTASRPVMTAVEFAILRCRCRRCTTRTFVPGPSCLPRMNGQLEALQKGVAKKAGERRTISRPRCTSLGRGGRNAPTTASTPHCADAKHKGSSISENQIKRRPKERRRSSGSALPVDTNRSSPPPRGIQERPSKGFAYAPSTITRSAAGHRDIATASPKNHWRTASIMLLDRSTHGRSTAEGLSPRELAHRSLDDCRT
mmetsp:Transcript_76200/g.174563  ORF Transcript_76200/g.174563 Transcript_76200/m.174563 type:complete len:291 (-) Transcript_76200:982-1854(-)